MFILLFELDVESIFKPFNEFLEVLNHYFYMFFLYGNYIFFLSFLIMGTALFLSAREIEYEERIHTNIQLVKARGRIGTAICLLIAFGFLFKGPMLILFDIFKKLPEPQLVIRYLGNEFTSIKSLNDIQTLSLHEKSIIFLISFVSFLALLLIFIGVYLLSFNKFILRSKLKFSLFISIGIIIWILVGFRTSLKLLV